MAEFASTDALRSAFTSESISRYQNLNLVGNFSVQQLELVFGEFVSLLPIVKTLRIYGSELTELPDVFARLENCEFIQVRKTPLARLPEWLFELEKLVAIDVSSLKSLVDISAAVNVSSLRSLQVGSCGLSSFPEGIEGCESLVLLNLSNNPIEHIDLSLIHI